MKKEISGTIYKTSDYGKFTFIKSNRELKSLGKLERAAIELGFYAPIIVNEKYEVIDGQHRLAVSEKLGIPVEYIVRPGLSIKDIISLNSSAKNWTLEDYIHAYTEHGLKNYETLQKVKKDFGDLPYSYLLDLAYSNSTGSNNAGNHGMKSSVARSAVIDGKFEFYNIENMKNYINYYLEITKSNGLKVNRNIFVSLYRLWALEDFDENRLREKIIPLKQKIVLANGAQSALLILLEVYNSNLSAGSKKRIDHSYDSKMQVVLHGKKREVEDQRILVKGERK